MYRTRAFAALGAALISGIALGASPTLADDGQFVAAVSASTNPAHVNFQAQQGADYVLDAWGYASATVAVVNPAGQPSPVLYPANSVAVEAEFRTPYTATYGIDISDITPTQDGKSWASGAVYTDCRGRREDDLRARSD